MTGYSTSFEGHLDGQAAARQEYSLVMDQFDAYIVHAEEDRNFAAELAQELTSRGFVVWFNAFIPGGHIRRQMEEGLKTSTFGVVVVSTHLFQKRWALEELDALYSLETLDTTRIIPVWHGVSATEVRDASPMLAARSAIVSSAVTDIARDVGEVIIQRTLNRSPAQWLRFVVGGGISWYTGPSWLGGSLRQYDDHFAEFFPAGVTRFPSAPAGPPGEIRPLIELLRAPVMHDGGIYTVVGHQDAPTQQVLERHFSFPTEAGQAPGPDVPEAMVSYVFQMRSVDFDAGQVVYVHCIGPYLPGWGPWANPDELCTVTGLPVAYGSVDKTDGTVGQCVYITARSVWFRPPEGGRGVTFVPPGQMA